MDTVRSGEGTLHLFIFRLFFFQLLLPVILCTCSFLPVQAGVCDSRCENREWWCSGGPEWRSHGSLIPPTLKVKASTPRSRGGEVETDR